jgi:O-antigen/teichoic acid export membrane protein
MRDAVAASLNPPKAAASSPAAAIRRKLLRGSITVFVGMAAGTILTLVFNAILARIVSHDTLGAYFLVVSMVTFGVTVAQLGLNISVVRFVSAARATENYRRARRAIALVFGICLISSVTLAVLVAAGLGQFVAVHVYHSPAVSGVITLAAIWIVLQSLMSLTAEAFRGFQRFWPATLFSGLAVDILLVIAYGSLWIGGVRPTLSEAVEISAGATGIAFLVGAVMLRRRVVRLRGSRGRIESDEIVRVSLPLLVSSVASFAVGTGIDLWVVGHFCTASDVALYGAASRLVFFVATPLIIISQVVPPIIAELHALGEREQLERALRTVSTLAGLPAALVLVIFGLAGGFVLSIAYGPFYSRAASVLVILSCARLVAVCTGSSGATLMMTGHQRTMMAITLCSACLSLGGEVVLAARFGMVGVAVATCVAQILQNALQVTFARLRVGVWTHVQLSLRPIKELVHG